MKKQMASSLMLATLLSLGIPVSVMADDVTPTDSTTQYNQPADTSQPSSQYNQPSDTSQPASQYNQPSSQTQYGASSGTSSSTAAQPGMSNLMVANQFGYTPNEVVVGTTDGSSPMVLPKIKIGAANTSIQVLNPTPKPVTFSVPALNLSEEVQPNSLRTIQIDKAETASLTPGQEIAYYINDSDGNQIASSNLVNNQDIATMIDTNTQVAAEEQEEPEPTASATPPQKPAQQSERRSTVRGYW